jgi:hypothetical protein
LLSGCVDLFFVVVSLLSCGCSLWFWSLGGSNRARVLRPSRSSSGRVLVKTCRFVCSSLFHCYLVAALCGSGRWLARTVRLVLLLHCERFGCGLLVAWLCLFCLFRKSLVSTFPLLPVLFLLLSPRFLCTRSLLVFSSHLLAFPESCSVAVAFAL